MKKAARKGGLEDGGSENEKARAAQTGRALQG
jgi:hypothetical protein